MVKINLLKTVDFLLKPVIVLLVFSMYCFIVATAMFLITTVDLFTELNLLNDDTNYKILTVYFPIFGKIFEVSFSISVILYLICIVYLFIKNGNYLYRYLFTLKLALIPFWIAAVILMVPMIIGGAFVSFFLMPVFGMFILPAFFLMMFYLVFVFTSVSNILFLLNLYKNKMMNKYIFLLNMIMQFCYFLDMVSAIYLKIRYKELMVKD